MPKENLSNECLSITILGSIIKVNKKYYPQIKIKIKNKKVENLINDDLELTSSDNESDNE